MAESAVTFPKEGDITCSTHTSTEKAKFLLILDPLTKLKCSGQYDIGGTYKDNVPEFWFTCKTTFCFGHNFLLNLFVIHRMKGTFSITIGSPKRNIENNSKEHFEYFSFTSSKNDMVHHIKTYCFSYSDLQEIDGYIPITIQRDGKPKIITDIVDLIKLEHNSKEVTLPAPDFILQSNTGKQFKCHRLMLAAHSSILREILENSKSNIEEFKDVNDEDMKLLLEFIYKGTIKNILNYNFSQLFSIAERFGLPDLFKFTQYVVSLHINSDNAIQIAVASEKFKLQEMQETAFRYIKNNPNALESEGWKGLDDIILTKKLLKFIHSKK